MLGFFLFNFETGISCNFVIGNLVFGFVEKSKFWYATYTLELPEKWTKVCVTWMYFSPHSSLKIFAPRLGADCYYCSKTLVTLAS